MTVIAGENLVPRGVAGSGGAYVLPKTGPDALTILGSGLRGREHLQAMQRLGQRVRAATDAKAKEKTDKAVADAGKNLRDDLQYKTETGRLFQPGFEESTADVFDRLTSTYKREQVGELSRFDAERERATIKRDTEALRIHGVEKQKAINDVAAKVQADPTRNYVNYTNGLAKSVLLPDGKRVRATDYDPNAAFASLDLDPTTYHEAEVVKKALHDVVPKITHKVAEAGRLGGQHQTDTVTGQLIASRNGKPLFNADGTPVLNLTDETQAMLDQGPVKILADTREAEYNKRREADPSLPNMTRRGHLASMFGPQVAYSQSHEEGMNAQVPRPHTPKISTNTVLAYPTSSQHTSFFQPAPGVPTAQNHYPAVGHSFGSQAKPYVEVTANTANIEAAGGGGQLNRVNPEGTSLDVPFRLQTRAYMLYDNGKRVGAAQPFGSDKEAEQFALDYVRRHPHASKLSLRVMGLGTVVDKSKTAGDGLGAAPKIVGYNQNTHQPIYDTSTTETTQSALVPMTQEMDAQLTRQTGGAWQRYKTSPQEAELIKAVRGRGGRLITPYTTTPHVAPQISGGPLAGRLTSPAPTPAPTVPVEKSNPYKFKFKKR